MNPPTGDIEETIEKAETIVEKLGLPKKLGALAGILLFVGGPTSVYVYWDEFVDWISKDRVAIAVKNTQLYGTLHLSAYERAITCYETAANPKRDCPEVLKEAQFQANETYKQLIEEAENGE